MYYYYRLHKQALMLDGDYMFGYIFKKIFGSKNERYLKRKADLVTAINALEPEMEALIDSELPTRLALYKKQVQEEGKSLDDVLVPVFALVRETSKRVLGMRHYDVQLLGGMVLHKGKIAEMKTGEGKTLVATLPVVLNALSGDGVHVITVNDYLAKRDAEWMGQVYSALGLTTGVIVHGLSDDERKKAYAADITYGTNNEFGFDYLRDNMKFYVDQLAQRGHNFAIVDEVDSILIDEARTPLIISGASEESVGQYRIMDDVVRKLEFGTHFTIDEKARSAMLTEVGVAYCEKLLKVENLFDSANITAQHHVLQALKAHHVFKRDTDYIVQDNQVVIVDEFTGRLMPGRRFSDGLHQALEAKERVTVAAENQTLASVTFQNYFRLYNKLSGMTGTADTEAVEFHEIYGLEVIGIPSHMPMVRKDYSDLIYRTKKEKFTAIVEAIIDLHKVGQPVLVGTISIENSELISDLLKKHNIPHNVLNAKHHEQEAEIVSQAGQRGKVTIATNMAGRGTDIVLGDGVTELGGLHILGTERHESRRIDNQLRGRSGRQGDPGSSRFYLSLEDDLMRLFGSERISGLMQKLGLEEGESIENAMVTKAVEGAQKRVEAHHFEIRKSLLDYDNVMSQQREVTYSLRLDFIKEGDHEPILQEFKNDLLDDIYDQVESRKDKSITEEDSIFILGRLRDIFNIDRVLAQTDIAPSREDAAKYIDEILAELESDAPDMYKDVIRYFLLEELDRCWKEHLRNMDSLRDGIGLRGYGQKDPKLEYKREGFELFQDMIFRIREGVFKALTRIRIQNEENNTEDAFKHKTDTSDVEYSGPTDAEQDKHTPIRTEKRAGRNEPCPCGSGRKYKKCCGL